MAGATKKGGAKPRKKAAVVEEPSSVDEEVVQDEESEEVEEEDNEEEESEEAPPKKKGKGAPAKGKGKGAPAKGKAAPAKGKGKAAAAPTKRKGKAAAGKGKAAATDDATPKKRSKPSPEAKLRALKYAQQRRDRKRQKQRAEDSFCLRHGVHYADADACHVSGDAKSVHSRNRTVTVLHDLPTFESGKVQLGEFMRDAIPSALLDGTYREARCRVAAEGKSMDADTISVHPADVFNAARILFPGLPAPPFGGRLDTDLIKRQKAVRHMKKGVDEAPADAVVTGVQDV